MSDKVENETTADFAVTKNWERLIPYAFADGRDYKVKVGNFDQVFVDLLSGIDTHERISIGAGVTMTQMEGQRRILEMNFKGFILLLPALIDSPPQFQLEKLLLAAALGSPGSLSGPMGREFTGWRDWVGRVRGWWSFRVVGVGENPIPKSREFPPQWPGASPLLAYQTLSQEDLRLPIITL